MANLVNTSRASAAASTSDADDQNKAKLLRVAGDDSIDRRWGEMDIETRFGAIDGVLVLAKIWEYYKVAQRVSFQQHMRNSLAQSYCVLMFFNSGEVGPKRNCFFLRKWQKKHRSP